MSSFNPVEYFKHSIPIRTYRPSDVFVLPDCRVGVEYEIEDVIKSGLIGNRENTNEYTVNSKDASVYWSAVKDGSLRNGGMEFITKPDMFGEDLDNALRSFDNLARDSFKPSDYGTHFSDRASTHIHIDIRDLAPHELYSMILNYLIFEDALFHVAGIERRKNNYCVPLRDTDIVLDISHLYKMDSKNPDSRRLSKLFGDEYRYAACNIQAIAKYGSLEFRAHRSCCEYEQIKLWINLLLSLKKYAKLKDPSEILQIVSKGNVLDFIYSVFAEYTDDFIRATKLSVQELTKLLFSGIRYGQNIVYYNNLFSEQKKIESYLRKLPTFDNFNLEYKTKLENNPLLQPPTANTKKKATTSTLDAQAVVEAGRARLDAIIQENEARNTRNARVIFGNLTDPPEEPIR